MTMNSTEKKRSELSIDLSSLRDGVTAFKTNMAGTEYKGDETQRELLQEYADQVLKQSEVVVSTLRSFTDIKDREMNTVRDTISDF